MVNHCRCQLAQRLGHVAPGYLENEAAALESAGKSWSMTGGLIGSLGCGLDMKYRLIE